jgi:hypothetical protein
MSPIEIGKSANAKRLKVKRNTPYIIKDLKLWKVSVVFHFNRIPQKKTPMSSGANSRRAYFLYHGKSSVLSLMSW